MSFDFGEERRLIALRPRVTDIAADGVLDAGFEREEVSIDQLANLINRHVPALDHILDGATSAVGAITAPARASRNARSIGSCLENAAPPQTRIADSA